jgi:D-amino-acid dehydrogenase
MKIAIIGAGIIGISTAYELQRLGFEVVVYDRHTSVAEETSFANAGAIAPGYVTPWSSPGMLWKILKHWPSRHSPVRVDRLLSISPVWAWQWLRACSEKRYLENRCRVQRLAHYSRDVLHEVAMQHELDYERKSGFTVLSRGVTEQRQAEKSLDFLRSAGVQAQWLDEQGIRALEPGLNPDQPFVGGIHVASDEVGNCRLYAQELKWLCAKLGVRFEMDTEVAPLSAAHPTRIQTPTQQQDFDAVVVCAGHGSVRLTRQLPLTLRIEPVTGYSITAPIEHTDYAPVAGLMDERYKVAISRMGQRLRVAGAAELGSRPGRLNPKSIQTLYKVLDDWFPGAVKPTTPWQHWRGERPMMANGVPWIGPSPVKGVWLNVGHGSSGWALSAGSARLLAQQLAHTPTDLQAQHYHAH